MSLKDKFTYNEILWNVIRRHPDYVEFCKNNKFDEDGWLIITDVNAENANKLKQRFGIMMILSCEIDADEWQLTILFRSANRAVTRVSDGINKLPETHIRVDIDTRAPISEIVKDIEHWLRLREITREVTREDFEGHAFSGPPYPFKKFKPTSDMEAFQVWDLIQRGKKPAEIAKTLWLEEYKKTIDLDVKYFELIKKYKKEGLENYDKKAHDEVYERNNPNYLFKRVERKKKRMEKLLSLYDE
jgi:hypothetical protein